LSSYAEGAYSIFPNPAEVEWLTVICLPFSASRFEAVAYAGTYVLGVYGTTLPIVSVAATQARTFVE